MSSPKHQPSPALYEEDGAPLPPSSVPPPAPASFDDLIPVVMDDKVTRAALVEVQRLTDKFTPMTQRASELHIEIDHDPVALGLGNFNSKLSAIRRDSNELGGYLTQAIHERARARTRRDQAKAAFEEKMDRTINNDPEIADISGMEAKKIAARQKLKTESAIVTFSEQLLTLVNGFHDAIKQRSDQLKETKSDLMSQLAVIKQQIALGEVDPTNFPIDRGGERPPVTQRQTIEQEVVQAIGAEGTTEF